MSNQQQSQTDFPDGYVTIESDNGQRYLVPHFMIPATHQAMEAYRKKLEFNVHKADGGVSSFFLHFNQSGAAVGRCQWSRPCVVPTSADEWCRRVVPTCGADVGRGAADVWCRRRPRCCRPVVPTSAEVLPTCGADVWCRRRPTSGADVSGRGRVWLPCLGLCLS